jgi:hypothetical protein
MASGKNRNTQIDFSALPHTGNDLLLGESSGSNLSNTLNKRKALEVKTNTLAEKDGLIPLRLPAAVGSGARAHQYFDIISDSPWTPYEKIYRIDLGKEWVTVAERRSSPPEIVAMRSKSNPAPLNLVIVRQFTDSSFQDNIRKFRQIQDSTFLSTLEVFSSDGFSYVVCEYMPLSLTYVCGNPLVNEVRLAAMVGQVTFTKQQRFQRH